MPKRLLFQTLLGLILAIMLMTFPALAKQTAPQAANPAWPSIKEAFDIASEGFIYGLPIVMNYAVMYDFCVDKNSGQYKGAVQPDCQRYPGLHVQGHEHRHAQQRHALFHAVAGPACRTFRALRPCSREGALLLGPVRVTAIPSITGTSAAAPPATTPAITWWSARTGRARRPPASRRCSAPLRNFLW